MGRCRSESIRRHFEQTNLPLAAERRQNVAHSVSCEFPAPKLLSLGRDDRPHRLLPPHPGLVHFSNTTPRLTPWATFCRASGAEHRSVVVRPAFQPSSPSNWKVAAPGTNSRRQRPLRVLDCGSPLPLFRAPRADPKPNAHPHPATDQSGSFAPLRSRTPRRCRVHRSTGSSAALRRQNVAQSVSRGLLAPTRPRQLENRRRVDSLRRCRRDSVLECARLAAAFSRPRADPKPNAHPHPAADQSGSFAPLRSRTPGRCRVHRSTGSSAAECPQFNFPHRPGAGPAAKLVPADSRSRERICPGGPAQHSSPSADPNPCQQTFQASPQFGNLDSEPRHGLLARSHWALPLGEVGPQRYLRPRTAPDSHHHPERMIPCPSSAPHRPSLP